MSEERYAELRDSLAEIWDLAKWAPTAVNTQPLQQSLDYARHLLERAAAEDHPGALHALRNAREADWKAGTARRLRPHNLLDRLGGWRKKS